MKYTFIVALAVFGSTVLYAQSGIEDKIITVPKDSEKTVYRLAGDYSEKHDVVTIAMLRGTAYKEDYDRFIPFFSKKLDSLNVPHMFFQYFVNDKPGTSFHYLIENDINGSFQYDELLALLPRIKRRYEKEYGYIDYH
ncbi:MAG: hypothetical protein HRT61_13480 [Ekhidna sp.]|nr:hypothetical protein [Ekhidna sp.]